MIFLAHLSITTMLSQVQCVSSWVIAHHKVISKVVTDDISFSHSFLKVYFVSVFDALAKNFYVFEITICNKTLTKYKGQFLTIFSHKI